MFNYPNITHLGISEQSKIISSYSASPSSPVMVRPPQVMEPAPKYPGKLWRQKKSARRGIGESFSGVISFASQLSVGFGVSSFLWSSVIIWLNEEPPHVCGSSNDAALSAGCCSAALEAGADLGGLQHKHGAQLLSSGASCTLFSSLFVLFYKQISVKLTDPTKSSSVF